MHTYSPYFTTLYDEQEPTGHLGRGTHYSILRAVSWHTPHLSINSRAGLYDFAIIWDEDHDYRVIKCVEELYLCGQLSKFMMFGERKANFTAIVSDEYHWDCNSVLPNVEWVAKHGAEGDSFIGEAFKIGDTNNSIINDQFERVSLYLSNIRMLWQLGYKPIPSLSTDGSLMPDVMKRT